MVLNLSKKEIENKLEVCGAGLSSCDTVTNQQTSLLYFISIKYYLCWMPNRKTVLFSFGSPQKCCVLDDSATTPPSSSNIFISCPTNKVILKLYSKRTNNPCLLQTFPLSMAATNQINVNSYHLFAWINRS